MSRRRRARRGPSAFAWVLIVIGVLGIAAIVLTLAGGPEPEVDDVTAPVMIDGDAIAPFTASGDDPAIGQAAPRVEGSDLGEQTMVIEPGSKPMAILFLAHWCPHCQAEVESLTDWLAENEFPEGVDVVSVSTLVDRTRGNYPPAAWLEDWPIPTLVDDEDSSVAEAFGLSGTPYWVFIDASGNVVERASGQMDIEALLGRLRALDE